MGYWFAAYVPAKHAGRRWSQRLQRAAGRAAPRAPAAKAVLRDQRHRALHHHARGAGASSRPAEAQKWGKVIKAAGIEARVGCKTGVQAAAMGQQSRRQQVEGCGHSVLQHHAERPTRVSPLTAGKCFGLDGLKSVQKPGGETSGFNDRLQALGYLGWSTLDDPHRSSTRLNSLPVSRRSDPARHIPFLLFTDPDARPQSLRCGHQSNGVRH